MQLKNFRFPQEFDSRDAPGSGVNMQKSTLIKLQKARDIAGIPFKINSAFRTVAHNRAVGGSANSAHTRGHAVDIAATTGAQKFRIVQAAMQAGFTRIGIYRNFIHVDDDPSLPQNVIW
jgi:zinc D-Ala-D-Ala carboxypeptidase